MRIAPNIRKLPGLAAALAAVLLTAAISGCGGSRNDDVSVSDPNFDPNAGIAAMPLSLIARTGPIVAVRVGDTAMLADNNSYSTSPRTLSYQWSFSARPHGSTAALQNSWTRNPSFVADVRGTYMVQLVVSADGLSSQRAIQQVVATVAPERPTGPVFHEGLSSSCVTCHNDDFSPIPPKARDHLGASNRCESCHTPLGWTPVPRVDHREVFGSCSQCHNGVRAIGKSDSHVPTTGECDACHNTTSFVTLNPDGSFDHTGITGGCAACHNGIVAIGKTPTPPHPDTAAECIFCHSTASFLGAIPDHSGPEVVGKRCDSCHGVSANGAPALPDHPLVTVDCEVCHSVTGFGMGGVFAHNLVDWTVQACDSCHFDGNNVGSLVTAPSKADAVPAHVATTADCSSCHNTETFTPAFGFDHTGVTVGCSAGGCHDGAGNATYKHATHMPSSDTCENCHTPGTFTTGTYDHAGVVGGCDSCHDNVISLGKLPNHLPTLAGCESCHTTTAFVPATWNHAGIDVNNCAQCHDGTIATGKADASRPHITTSADCSACHNTSNFTTFAGIVYNHQGIDPNDCASCHAAGLATPKKINHIPTQDDCSACHTSTANFLANDFFANRHGGITQGCEGCHTEFFFPGDPTRFKGVGHLPTGQDCYLCHANTAFAPDTFEHTGIASNCGSCHDGNFDATGALGKPVTHIPVSQDCGACHTKPALNPPDVLFAPAFVDHGGPDVVGRRCDSCHGVTAIGKTPGHVVTTQDCAVCHLPGAFSPAVFDHSGIVDNCASCHDGTTATGKADAPTPHIPTSQDCSVCHNPTAFANAHFDHQGITGNCASCHNGTTATGKHNNHLPTNGDCVQCHQTTGFVPATFDHAGIVDNCFSCHDGTFARGKTTGHVPTNQDCGVCHNTQGFVPATFDHTGIVDNCASCHVDGSPGVTGKDDAVPAHLATSLDCHFCHTTATFVGGSWFHDSSTVGQCDSCHSPGGGATAKPAGHLPTTYQCDTCHVTSGWAPTTFTHSRSGDYPGDHQVNPSCTQCHGNSIDPPFPWPFPRYAPFCAACHASDFSPQGDHNGGRSGTVEQNKNCAQSGCHRISDRNWD